MADGDIKDLTKRTASDKILPDKAFNIAKNLKYHGSSGSGIKNENISNKRPLDLARKAKVSDLRIG